MKRKKFILLGLFLALVVGGIFATLRFREKEQEIRKGAADQPHLYVEQSDLTTQSRLELDLYVDTAGEKTNGVDAIIDYDPQVLDFVTVTKGYFFNVQAQFEFKEENGRIYVYSIAPSPLITETGKSKVAQIIFDIKKQQTTKLSFVCDLGNLNSGSSAIWQGKEAINIIDCASLTDFTYTPFASPTGKVSVSPTEPVATLTPTSTPKPTATSMPLATSTPIPTPEADKATINFEVSLQGIKDSSAVVSNPTAKVIIKDGFSTVAEFSDVELIPSEENKFKGQVVMAEWGGTYTVYIKGEKHLSRKFCYDGQIEPCSEPGTISLITGVNNFDFSGRPLQPGDIVQGGDQSDLVNKTDFLFLQDELGNTSSSIADLDYNGLVHGRDIVLFLQTLATKYGDNI